ncbi:MAG: peptidoglycan DD-metalloendopeptidase family protein [Candidatus Kapabacteria bacterium]|nr:peptidoglycan DD-metalloendopeptidase family protein [Candidatus Kapabacteria bacterium]
MSGQSSITATKNELLRLRQSIEQTRTRIDALNRRESSALSSLSSYQRTRHNLTVFISQLETDLARLQDTARVVVGRIAQTQSALTRAEQSWRDASRRMLTYRTEHQGEPPASLRHDAVYRSITSSLTEYRRQMLNLKDSLTSQKSLLEDVSSTQVQIITAKERERNSLAATITKSQVELERLRSNKKSLETELQKKQQSARRVRTLINELVAKDRARSQQQSKTRRGSSSTSAEDDVRTGPIPQRDGFRSNSLPWPTPTTGLLHGYGTYKNPETGMVLENPGIDIKATIGTRVVSVARGEVSSVTWLPGYGSLVIVDHGNGFRTVYANLETVAVKSGSAVQSGTTVGSSGENIDGKLVHFELWYGSERQNPLTYLR